MMGWQKNVFQSHLLINGTFQFFQRNHKRHWKVTNVLNVAEKSFYFYFHRKLKKHFWCVKTCLLFWTWHTSNYFCSRFEQPQRRPRKCSGQAASVGAIIKGAWKFIAVWSKSVMSDDNFQMWKAEKHFKGKFHRSKSVHHIGKWKKLFWCRVLASTLWIHPILYFLHQA